MVFKHCEYDPCNITSSDEGTLYKFKPLRMSQMTKRFHVFFSPPPSSPTRVYTGHHREMLSCTCSWSSTLGTTSSSSRTANLSLKSLSSSLELKEKMLSVSRNYRQPMNRSFPRMRLASLSQRYHPLVSGILSFPQSLREFQAQATRPQTCCLKVERHEYLTFQNFKRTSTATSLHIPLLQEDEGALVGYALHHSMSSTAVDLVSKEKEPEFIYKMLSTFWRFLSDSQLVLITVLSTLRYHVYSCLVYDALPLFPVARTSAHKMHLQWIISNCGIQGNEAADESDGKSLAWPHIKKFHTCCET